MNNVNDFHFTLEKVGFGNLKVMLMSVLYTYGGTMGTKFYYFLWNETVIGFEVDRVYIKIKLNPAIF